jgi:Skp family chaperone for outer membrane proteins
MKLLKVATVAALALVPGFSTAEVGRVAEAQAGTTVTGPTGTPTKIAVIDIERIAAESNEGKALFEDLKVENDKLQAESQRRQQEIADLQAKLNSEILSQDARLRLQRDVERKRTEAQRWLEDAQAEFEAKRQDGEVKFQEKLGPVVEAVAQENGIGLIFRATPGLTFVLDANLDISPLVVQKLDAGGPTPPAGDDAGSDPQ